MQKIRIVLCGVMMMLLLTACGGSSGDSSAAVPVEVPAANPEQPVSDSEPEIDNNVPAANPEQAASDSKPEIDNNAAAANYEEEIAAEPIAVSLRNQVFEKISPFSEGLACVQYADEKGNDITSVINTNGEIVFTIEYPIIYFSQYQDGYAYYVYEMDFEPGNGVHPDKFVSCIVDRNGTITYDSKADGVRIILAHGDGHFLAVEHISTFDTEDWYFGSIDKDGNTLIEFATYDNKLLYLNDMKYLDYGDVSGEFVYLGEGIFYLHGNNGGKLYNVREQKVIHDHFHSTSRMGNFQNGYMIYSYYDYSLGVYSINTNGDVIEYDLRKSFDRSEMFVSDYAEGVFFYDRAYHTIDGSVQNDFPQYDDKLIAGGRFNKGYAPLYIQGANGKNYFTIIDSQGNELIEPTLGSPTEAFSEGYLAVQLDSGCALYNTQGEKIFECPYNILGSMEAPNSQYSDWDVDARDVSSVVSDGYFVAYKEGSHSYTPTVFVGVDGSYIGQ